MWLLVRRYAPFLVEPAALRAFVRSFGPLAPLAFVAVQALQVVVAPVPGHVVAFTGGYLFGTVAGTAYSLVGVTIGSYVAFALSRRFGRPFVERVLDPDLLASLDAALAERAEATLFVVFLVPGLPDDVVCFVGGLTPVPIRRLVVVALVGRSVGFFVANLAGARLAQARPLEAVALAVLLALASLVGFLKRDALLRRLGAG